MSVYTYLYTKRLKMFHSCITTPSQKLTEAKHQKLQFGERKCRNNTMRYTTHRPNSRRIITTINNNLRLHQTSLNWNHTERYTLNQRLSTSNPAFKHDALEAHKTIPDFIPISYNINVRLFRHVIKFQFKIEFNHQHQD